MVHQAACVELDDRRGDFPSFFVFGCAADIRVYRSNSFSSRSVSFLKRRPM